jgi:hypothetical protein
MILTLAEEKLVQSAREGEFVDFRSTDFAANDPAQGATWGSERTIRAEVIVGTLDFLAAKISRPIVLIKCYMTDPIILIDASATTIALNGSHIRGMSAFRLTTSGSVLLKDGFIATDEGVELCGAHIGGDLDCEGGTLKSSTGPALFADGLQVQGNLFLRAQNFRDGCKIFRAIGEVRLLAAHIHGDLDCSGGTFEGVDRALSADRLAVDGDVCLRNGFLAKGEVRLAAAELRGNLDCACARFQNPSGWALSADSASIGRDLLIWNGFQARGGVRFVGAKINGDLNCSRSSLVAESTPQNPHGFALSADRAKAGALLFLKLIHPPKGVISFVYAKAALLNDDLASWPASGSLWLDGFVYDTIAGMAPIRATERLEWLGRQSADGFRPQPYEQLIRVLRQMGHDRDARRVAIAKQKALRTGGQLGVASRAWNLTLGATIGHGYRPWLAILWMLLLVTMGSGVFYRAFRTGVMSPSSESQPADRSFNKSEHVPSTPTQPKFHPLLYSIDVFLPFVDLHEKSAWRLSEAKTDECTYFIYQFYFLGHVILGWLLTGLLVGAAAGLIKKD